ncbi:MAG TPA: four helix bundle protein [Pyrinomonadaceae bacterium]|nr:four helix bundle protein [Pyrinomonadaceae bacterium]
MMNEKEAEAASCDLQVRTKAFALRVVRLYCALPKTTEAQILGKQALRSGTSVGAHYREAMRARSSAEFVSKIEGGLQELEETNYWLELLIESGIVPETKLTAMLREADELTAMLVASARTAKRNR